MAPTQETSAAMTQSAPRWHRTQLANPDAPRICAEDWTLIDGETGEALARIYDTEQPDILGNWRWEVAPFFMTANRGSALTGTDARMKCEKRLGMLSP
jgi:hypothetical protein